MRAGDDGRVSDIFPDMEQVMLLLRTFLGMGYVLLPAVMLSIITWCVCSVCCLCYECLVHTPSNYVFAQENALEVRSAGTTRTMMMH